MDEQEIIKRFTHHPPSDEKIKRHEEIRAKARFFADRINEICPDGREKSLALTALEEALFWANASIARNE